jgi:hypothetical protein
MAATTSTWCWVDTAPEAHRERALDVLRRADWTIVPVNGPEASSVQALPMLMQWIAEADHPRVLGFLPTMHKPRREKPARGSHRDYFRGRKSWVP